MIADSVLPANIAAPVHGPRQFTLKQILSLWAAIALPNAALAWLIMPLLVPRLDTPPALLFWLLMILGLLWQAGLGGWISRRERSQASPTQARDPIGTARPRNGTVRSPRPPRLWHLLPGIVLAAGVVALGALLPSATLLLRLFGILLPDWRIGPAYLNVVELASPEYAGQWWLLALALATWLLTTLLAEERLFRGLLLPRMAGAFGRHDWLANAVLFGLAYLHKPWMIPFRWVEGLILSGVACRWQDNRLGLIVRSLEGVGLLALVWIGVSAHPLTSQPVAEALPHISSQPAPLGWYQGALSVLPACDQPPGTFADVDLRGADLSALDLRDASASLACADFDSGTAWPPAERLPAGFDPDQILALGRNPGLGVRGLHAQGITGRGVGLAIIDQAPLVTHQEYARRLLWYEALGSGLDNRASMHGAAVASIAVGQSVGVAPEADLYFIGTGSGLESLFLYGHDFAQGIQRLLQLNGQLPVEHRIRVISISSGWRPDVAGYYDAADAAREAEAQGVLVLTVGALASNGLMPQGLGREPLADPDAFASYQPGLFWAAGFYGASQSGRYLLVPMDSRTVASPTGDGDYAFYRAGGMSWVVPYVAGVYVLAAQVDPSITPDEFWALARSTGRSVDVIHQGQTLTLSTVMDPVALIEALR